MPIVFKGSRTYKKTSQSFEDPVLLLMDNHESHCTLDAINYCCENGMVVLTFPPHCTHRMQPLDVAFNGPFKQKLSQNDWLVRNPGKAITINDLVGIVIQALLQHILPGIFLQVFPQMEYILFHGLLSAVKTLKVLK